MSQTVYLIYERVADSLNSPGRQTRVYVDEDLAKQHVADNHDPMLDRWMVPQESSDGQTSST